MLHAWQRDQENYFSWCRESWTVQIGWHWKGQRACTDSQECVIHHYTLSSVVWAYYSLSWLKRIWYMDILTCRSRFMAYVEISRKGSNTKHHLMKGNLGEHKESFNWFMQMFFDQWTWHQWLLPWISFSLLMTILGKCGCAFWNWDRKCFMNLKNLKH